MSDIERQSNQILAPFRGLDCALVLHLQKKYRLHHLSFPMPCYIPVHLLLPQQLL